jgi:hypothetical protein
MGINFILAIVYGGLAYLAGADPWLAVLVGVIGLRLEMTSDLFSLRVANLVQALNVSNKRADEQAQAQREISRQIKDSRKG